MLLTGPTEDAMEVLRQSGQHAGKMSAGSGSGVAAAAAAAAATSAGGASSHSAGAGASAAVPSQQSQGLAALLVMVAVLCFIVAYCCWGAPCCRAFCRRRCAAACCACCGCRADLEAASPSDLALSVDQGMVATPTIILLPYGRMLVVDGSVFAQLQADTSGLDLIELGENVVRAQQRQQHPPRTPSSLAASSTPSVLEVDTETLSKDGAGSPTISLHPPPTYESIFGCFDMADLPPSYDEILRQIEMREFRVASRGGGSDGGGGDGDTGGGGEEECLAPNGPPPEADSRQPEAQPLTATIAEAEEDYEPGDIRESRV
ncbi:uncharacterized protein LOC126266835 isoform X2 [Schistocerca gregaria]|uniref:uncharacterized protein LOC126266835 isoform X2 n=1 Tax=Schistocerca gregaria TaxID=7010 RepID=UPI00211F1083|nr:uncharacterized protein LOC126266835 isoform X2 [Schistocerca gregaria]